LGFALPSPAASENFLILIDGDSYPDCRAAVLRTRPIYHVNDAAIRGHVFCSFLALVLSKELARLCAEKHIDIEWADLLRDLDRLQQATIEKDGKQIVTRTHVTGQVGAIFKAAGVALPQNLREQAL